MSTFLSQLSNSFPSQGNPNMNRGNGSPLAQSAQAGSESAMEFQLWVSQQATSLAKLKIFSTMAKNVNDQQ